MKMKKEFLCNIGMMSDEAEAHPLGAFADCFCSTQTEFIWICLTFEAKWDI